MANLGFFYAGGSTGEGPGGVLEGQPTETDKKRRLGYTGTENIANTEPFRQGPVGYSPSGGGEDIVDGYKKAGTSAYDKDVDRARRMGDQSHDRDAPTLDQGNADEARGIQMGSLGLLRQQADGSAPSAAAILSQRANSAGAQQIARQQLAGRSPGARIAASGNAMSAGSLGMLQANAANAGQRAGEISRGQAGLAAGSVGVQGQDTSAAVSNAQFEQQQRALNEARQQNFERQGWNVRKTQQQAADDFYRQQQEAEAARARQDAAKDAENDAVTMGWINRGLNLLPSDPQAKTNIRPMGSLGHLMNGRR